jgi:galactokinase
MTSNQQYNIFVPGRLLLFGDHADWPTLFQKDNDTIVDGYALVIGIEYGIYSIIQKSNIVHIKSNYNNFTYEYKQVADKPQTNQDKNSFLDYAIGTAHYMINKYSVGGIDVNSYKTTLPVCRGLSSSAAMCMTLVRGYNLVYNLSLSEEDEMNDGFEAERSCGSGCGRIDQTCILGKGVRLLHFHNDEIDIKNIKSKSVIPLLWIDLGILKDVKGIINDLMRAYPYAKNPNEQLIHDTLGSINNMIVTNAIDYFKDGNIASIGKLMNQAQLVFDKNVAPYSPHRLNSPYGHALLNDNDIMKWSLGGKMVTQGDSSVILIFDNTEIRENANIEIKNRYGYNTMIIDA